MRGPGESRLQEVIERVAPLEQAAQIEARRRQDQLTKPPGSLGRLERIAIQVAGITGEARPHLAHKVVIVAAGDHGVTAEGVSAYPSEQGSARDGQHGARAGHDSRSGAAGDRRRARRRRR